MKTVDGRTAESYHFALKFTVHFKIAITSLIIEISQHVQVTGDSSEIRFSINIFLNARANGH